MSMPGGGRHGHRRNLVSSPVMRGVSADGAGFEVGFVAGAGQQQRMPLVDVAAAEVAFELVAPSRSFPSFQGQRNNTGWWFFATTVHTSGSSPGWSVIM
jgi:hypothetical protein